MGGAKGDIMRLGGETRGYGVIFQQGRIQFLCRRSLTSGLSLTLTLLVLDDSFLARLDFLQLFMLFMLFPVKVVFEIVSRIFQNMGWYNIKILKNCINVYRRRSTIE